MATPNTPDKRRLFITHVNAVGHYLKICGQLNPDAMQLVRQKMHKILSTCMAIDPIWPLERHHAFVKPGAICLFKSVHGAAPTDFEFMRARIIKTVDVVNAGPSQHLRVEVDFIDYGYTQEVRSFELLVPQRPEQLQTIPVLCTEYILLGICADWNKQKLNEIESTIKNHTVEITIQYELYHHKFIDLKWKDFDLAEYLILQHKTIGGAAITNELLLDFFQKNESKKKMQLANGTTNVYTTLSNPTNGTTNGVSLNTNNQTLNNNNAKYINANLHATMRNYNNNYAPMLARGGGRSLASRLQVGGQLQVGVPRMPQSIGNLRNMMQGRPLQSAPHLLPNMPQYYQHAAQPVMVPAYMAFVPPLPLPDRPYNNNVFVRKNPVPQTYVNGSISAAPQKIVDIKKNTPPVRRLTTATFKTNHLTVGEIYDVLVSFVENGPYVFSVQLVSQQNELCQMMTAIESVEKELERLTENPTLGTACIARYSEDHQLYRALITNVQAHACKVAYIDYGNAELVDYNNLFQIPERFLEAKAYAIRCCLSGNKSIEPIDDSLKKTFAESVTFKNCKLKVMPLEGPPVVQYCELYNEGQNMLDVLKSVQSKRSVYPKAENLSDNDVVEIRYIESPKRFFVQKVSNIKQFHLLMDEMFTYYNKNQVVPTQLQLGAPCIVKDNNDWCRGEIIRDDDTAIIVRHVDFGYEQSVTRNLIGAIAPQHLKMPRQAVQCCLKGFENNELDKDLAITQFEMLAEDSNLKRRMFTVKIFRIEPNGINLVNLYTKELNVMKKLYKLSMPFEEYVSLEKVDFNMSRRPKSNQQQQQQQLNVSLKTPSISSTNSVTSIHSALQQGKIMNSTTLLSEEQIQQKLKAQQKLQAAVHLANNKENLLLSPTNSYNRDARSSASSDMKSQNNRQQRQQQQQRHPNKQQQNLNSSMDTGSMHSSLSASSYNKSNRSGSYVNSPQHHRNNKKERSEHNARPQNAPKGFSQSPRNKQNQTPRPQQHHSQHDKRVSSPISAAPATAQTNGLVTIAEEYMPLDRAFPTQLLNTPTRDDVYICWWVSPHLFYTQLKSRIAAFEQLTQEMQQFYKQKPTQQLQLRVGSHVIARHRKDNIVHRARVLQCNQMLRKYKVVSVDTGIDLTVTSEDIWQVEQRFAKLPCMAYQCRFAGIITNYDHLYILDRMEKYLTPGAAISCEFNECRNGIYYADIDVNKKSLKEMLISAKLLTAVDPGLNVELLAGQQIRAKISGIRDMLNFKIQIEGCPDHIKFLASYDDVRFVKSNNDLSKKFKNFYEGMSCVVNIKNVNDNKVILLRPLLPLFKPDIRNNICTYPIVMQSFAARVVFIASGYRLYCQALSNETEVMTLLDEMYDYYQEKGGEPLRKFERDQICAALASDENWYRARIKSAPQQPSDLVEVYYIDYGNTEKLQSSNLRKLAEKFYLNKSAYAVEVNLPIRTNVDLLHKSKKSAGSVVDASTDADVKIVKALENMTLEKTMIVNAIEVRHNHLIADLIIKEGQSSVIDLLLKQKLIKARDVDYMRKVLDKEPPNMLEYIETVDLTLEDEEKLVKAGSSSSPKQKTSSPKKGKQKDSHVKEPEPEPIAKPSVEQQVESTAKLEEPQAILSVPVSVPEKLKAAESTPTNSTAAPTPEPDAEAIDPYADMEQAVLSHCDNPAQFFVHLQHRVEELYKLQENLQIVASMLPPLMSVVNGANCISLYSVDKQWYRAKILDAELMVLKFIDFGNTDCVSDPTEVKEMSVFPDIEPFCLPCGLPIRPNGTADWVDAANAIFNDSYNKVLHFEYITHGDLEKRSFINLFIDGVNVAEKLIADGFAKPLELVESGENCYISHVNTITDFYIQYEKDSKALELMECYLSDSNNLKPMTQFERGKIVAALFPDDGMWYRAKLLKHLPNNGGYEVLFIDYGNTSTSAECREISEEFAKLPTLSKKCALELPAVCVAWSEAAEEKFAEFAALGETIFTVELREPSADHAIVQLFIDGQNISEELQPLCEQRVLESLPDLNASICNTTMATSVYESGALYDAIVSHINSTDNFYIQFDKNSERLADIVTSINALGMEPLTQPQVGQLCAAVFDDDGLLYRARILAVLNGGPKCRVHFIDYGNETVSDDLRVLPQDLQQVQEFCRNCRLENSTKFNEIGEVATATFEAMLGDCDYRVKVDVLSCEMEGASLVKLFTANTEENVCEKLNVLLNIEKNSPLSVDSKHCVISHGTSPKQFYVQLKSNSVKMDFIKKQLNKAKASAYPLLVDRQLGQICCIYSEEDDSYYRGKMLAEDGEHFEVFLLDYGSTVKVQQLRELPKVLMAIPALAVKCKLNVIPEASDKLVDERFAELIESHFGEVYEILEDKLEEDLHVVQLQVNYKDLAVELQEAVVNKQVNKPVMPELHDCSIVIITAPQSFYIQLSSDFKALETIAAKLQNAEEEFAKVDTQLKVGDLCAAQFVEDDIYYRAKILEIREDNKYEVYFIDYGNVSTTEKIRELPAELREVPGYAKRCSLGSELSYSNEQFAQLFNEFVDSKFSETFQVEFLTTNTNPRICRLFYQNKDVAKDLLDVIKAQHLQFEEIVEEVQDGVVEINGSVTADLGVSSGVGSMEEMVQ